MSLRVAVFASGGGSNLQSLIDRLNGRAAKWGRVVLAVSDRPSAGALERARLASLACAVIPVRDRPADAVSADTLDVLEAHDVDIIALAGYLRLVPEAVVARYRGRIVNIHPALLPAFGGAGMYGLRVHRAVIEAGCRVSGATVHHVDERYDEGKPVAQWPVPVYDGDTPESLAARVLRVEHRLYPLALELLARGLSDRPRPAGSPPEEHSFVLNGRDPDEGAMRRALGLT